MNPNRSLYRKAAQTCRRLLAEEGKLPYAELAENFVRILLKKAAEEAGVSLPEQSAGYVIPSGQTRLELPDGLEQQVRKVLDTIPSEDWRNRPEWAGWLYQYVLEERKDTVFAQLKSGKKAGAEDIPAVTQLFTPEWIARYMAENTIGRLWLRCRPESLLLGTWPYFDSAAEPDRFADTSGRSAKDPEAWSVLDPACGCGHVLAAAFDVLLEVYREAGTPPSAAVRLILSRNLRGLDIDPLAADICRAVLFLKAVRIDASVAEDVVNLPIRAMHEPGKEELGSLLRPEDCTDLEISAILGNTYDAVITNPPYLGRRHMSDGLAAFLDQRYPRSRNDLFAAFLERAMEFLRPGGYHAVVNQHAWMYLSGYEELRRRLLSEYSFVTLLHLGTRAFEDIAGEVVQTVSFVLRKEPPVRDTFGMYWNLTADSSPGAKESVYLERTAMRMHRIRQLELAGLPGARLAYGLRRSCRELFRNAPPLSGFFAVKKGMDTGGNDKYVRFWHEVPEHTLSFRSDNTDKAVWFPYAKGGGFRQWYGNHYYVVRWADNGRDIRLDPRSNLRNEAFYGKPGITWSTVSTERAAFRLLEPGFLFDNGGSCLFPLNSDRINRFAALAYLNSGLADRLLQQLNPTVNVQPGDVSLLPADESLLNDPELARLGEACVKMAKQDWDETEWSWSFREHPLAQRSSRFGLLEEAYRQWCDDRASRVLCLQEMEESINRRIGLKLGLGSDLPELRRKEPLRPSEEADLHGLLSYAVGCMLGRYTVEGVKEPFELLNLEPARLIPRFECWLTSIWGAEYANRNMAWLGSKIGCRRSETPGERIARYFKEQFVEDHVSAYFKRPYYARLSSGPTKAFDALTPIRQLNRQLLGSIRQQVEEQLRFSAASCKPEARGELLQYLRRIMQFMENNPEDLPPDSCSRTMERYYRPIIDESGA